MWKHGKQSTQGVAMKKGTLTNPENDPKTKIQESMKYKLRQQKSSETNSFRKIKE